MLRDRQQKGAVVRTEYSHLMTNKVVARSEVRGDLPRPGVVVRDHDVRRGPLAVRRLAELVDLELQKTIVSLASTAVHSDTHPDGIGARLPSCYVARRAGLRIFREHHLAPCRRRRRTM